MNGWEIACVVIGILMLISSGTTLSKSYGTNHICIAIIYTIIEDIIGAAMVLLPLYFVYWRR